MFNVSVKLAFGFFTANKNFATDTNTTQLINELKTLIKTSLTVEPDADIQIVEAKGVPFAELSPELTPNSVISSDFFYARVVRKFNNVEYFKTDIDCVGNRQICYIKKEGLQYQNQPRYLLLSDILHGSEPEPNPEPEQIIETCVLCYENEVHHEQLFNCTHLFCGSCLSEWRASSTHFNCPLCRS